MTSTIFKVFSVAFFSLFLSTYTLAETSKKGLYLGAKTATHPTWFKDSFLDLEDDIADAANNNKRLVIYF